MRTVIAITLVTLVYLCEGASIPVTSKGDIKNETGLAQPSNNKQPKVETPEDGQKETLSQAGVEPGQASPTGGVKGEDLTSHHKPNESESSAVDTLATPADNAKNGDASTKKQELGPHANESQEEDSLKEHNEEKGQVSTKEAELASKESELSTMGKVVAPPDNAKNGDTSPVNEELGPHAKVSQEEGSLKENNEKEPSDKEPQIKPIEEEDDIEMNPDPEGDVVASSKPLNEDEGPAQTIENRVLSKKAGEEANVSGGGKRMTNFNRLQPEAESSHFFAYLVSTAILVAALYIAYHNKRKILAYCLEGKKSRSSRRPNSTDYQKLDQKM